MENDSSDILGHKTMPTLNGNQRGWFPFSVTQALATSVLVFGIYWAGQRLWKHVLQWRERSYRLATRRRHGIPDSDLRPFNVAYSEAFLRAREEESRRHSKPMPALRPQASLPTQREMLLEHNLRHRQGVPQRPDPGMRSTVVPVPGGYNTASFEPRMLAETSAAADPYYPRQSVQPTTNGFSKPNLPSLSRHGGYLDISDADALSDTEGEGRKRALDEEQDEEHEAKKTRVEGDELIDGDEDAEFEDLAPKRGSKRGLRDEEESEDVTDSKKSRGKRARKVFLENRLQADEGMDVDDEEADEITELKSSTRGKKRDRAEAGSTFGGDDEDSAAELELEGDAKARRRRKRRTVAKRKSEASYIRGKKRERNGDDDVSDNASEGSSPDKVSRKKKGKRSSHVDRRDRERQASKSDVSMDESTTSTRSKVRNIGDEWESNGVKYKIGPNYQRLRQALVKKARQKFVMPKDSQHPDRDANLQVCIETWLTEEEYQEAKAQHLLAWQDPPSAMRHVETGKLSLNISQDNVPSPQGPTSGKNLLWSTSASSTPTMSPASQSPGLEAPPELAKQRSYRDTHRHSIATTAGLPISPFTQTQIPSAKRIASNSRAVSMSSSLSMSVNGSPGLSDSTNGSPRIPQKVFSKWEKQELEARAMMKIREANKKKEMEKELKLKEEKERMEREAAERQRVERERQERERAERDRDRQEKDRQERERAAEADRKAKEAAEKAKAAAPTPQITIPAPASQPGAPTAAPPSSTGSSMPNFFRQPASAAPKVEPSTVGSQQPGGFSFGHSAQPATGASQAQGGAARPASTSNNFSFGAPSTTPAQKPVSFSFGSTTPLGSGEQKEGPGATAASPAGNGGGSLLSRLGPQAPEAPKTQAPSQPATNPTFSFPKPSDSFAPSQGTSNPFGQPAAPTTTATTTPRFSFNVGNKASTTPASSTTTNKSAFPSTASSSLSGALGSGDGADPQKATTATSTPLSFSFKTPTTPASALAGANGSTTPATAPKSFGFGTSAFGTQGKEAGKSAFGATTGPSAFGTTSTSSSSAFGNTTAPSAFGTTSTPSSTSAFGNTTTPSAFGNTKTTSAFSSNAGSGPSPFGATSAQKQNVFGGGGAAAKPADGAGSKPLFSFSNPASSTSSTTGSTTTNGAPNFPFPTTTTLPAATGGESSGGHSFKFGQPASGTAAPQSSAFGTAATNGQSTFGGTSAMNTNGNGTSTTTPSTFGGGGVFGKQP